MNDKKTLRDMNAHTFNTLIDLLDRGFDWENIIGWYPNYIDDRMEKIIRNNCNVINYSPSRAVLEYLRNNLVPISNLYECFKANSLDRCSEVLEQEFPNEINGIKKKLSSINTNTASKQVHTTTTTTTTTPQSTECSNSSSLMTKSSSSHLALSSSDNHENQENLLLKSQQQQLYQTQQARQQQLLQASNTLQALITIYEEILPVIYENKPSSSASSSSSNNNTLSNQDQSSNKFGYDRSMKLYGKFEIIYIQERKLTFKKREFYDPYDYIRELKMIKHRHFNMYTAECILKNLTNNRYYALYPYDDPVHTKLLSEHAFHNYTNLKPSQFNTLHQLIILRDIACGLTYLHEKSEYKKNTILHGNLQPDNVLVVLQEDKIKAKIFDFAKTIEVNESENFDSKLREEFYNFGLIIMLVLTWKYIDRLECEKIHSRPHGDPNIFQYALFKEFNIDKQPNAEQAGILLRMFFALTSPDYDIHKGIKRSYDKINQLLEKLNSERTRTVVFT